MDDLKKQILDAYYFRHACKEFDTDKKISEVDFNFILETGRLSPSSFGFEPWKFLVVQSPKLIEIIKAISWGARGKLPAASHFVVILARTFETMKPGSDYISQIMNDVQKHPVDIIETRLKNYDNFIKNDFKLLDNDRVFFEWTCRQTYIALGNMMTSAAMIGVDSCPIEGFDREALESALETEGVLDRKVFGISCMAAFGYRAKEPRPKTRRPMEQVVEWV